MSTTKRISLTIDSGVLDDLDFLCSKLSVTRSSLISEFLRPTVSDVRKIVDFALPSSPDSDAPKARNPEYLRSFLENLMAERLESAEKEFKEYQLDWEKEHGEH